MKGSLRVGTKIEIISTRSYWFFKTGDVGYLTDSSCFHEPGQLSDKNGHYWMTTEEPGISRICIGPRWNFKVLEY